MQDQGYKEHEGFGLAESFRFSAGLFLLAVFAMTTPFQVILHHSHGSRYFKGGPVLISLIATVLWTGMWPDADPRPMFAIYYLFLGMTAVRGLQCLRRRSRPLPGVHSSYNGTPYLLTRWFDERTAKHKVEPILLLLAGGAVLQLTEPLGCFLMAGGACLTAETAMAIDAQRARDEAVADARIEAGMARDRRWG
ncbi:hypothetical protein [Paludisphaera rhizosphaerae]|uniref:hypothetical protein n=1 Tax=Paludisphaera rhizosphaerae TaxID=2711216 RepID=UPI0013EA89E0|nr:hypothetical protein [Paludisphaera rhizosphaerae]